MKKLMILAILAVVALAILDITYQPKTEPDVVCPIANQHIEISYTQSKNPR